MCESAERASQGQQEQQLNIHGGEKFSPPVKTFKGSLGAKSTTPEPSHTRHTHTPTGLSGGEGPKNKKVKKEDKVVRGEKSRPEIRLTGRVEEEQAVALTAGGRKRVVEGCKEDKRKRRSCGHFEEVEGERGTGTQQEREKRLCE
ncbi:hypothetical protein KUCAC02_012520 [Chaenocephalus aceratus]|uniref:Uncharacterized protein n=1 Tax=Chaenocephalus aceratus TaxID=36190 RepID=A0ACB9XAW1_CHAAC|nr:hypothetical protein KUCAC02_012520 [Chaenocephalus aceratus]